MIGGSYAGVQLVRRLAETLPTGYRVILIGRKTHFNHLFNFPRYAVIKGWEATAFIPYDGIGSGWLVPEGVFKRVVGNVVRVGEDEVQLEDEECIPYTFLAICTGATLPLPATLSSSSKADGCAELRMMQDKIENAQRIAIVGGGAVGVQITGDVRSFYPEKEVVFVHSREWLLSGFGRVLGDHIKERYEHMGIRILLGERPVLGREGEDAKDELVFRDGSRESFDLVVSFVALRILMPSYCWSCHSLIRQADPMHRSNPQLIAYSSSLSRLHLRHNRRDYRAFHISTRKHLIPHSRSKIPLRNLTAICNNYPIQHLRPRRRRSHPRSQNGTRFFHASRDRDCQHPLPDFQPCSTLRFALKIPADGYRGCCQLELGKG